MAVWQTGGTVLSLLISLAAAGFTGMQWYENRGALLLSTKPHVDFDVETDPDEPPVGIAISNAGPGPATIKSVIFYVDRKSVQDAEEAGTTYGKLSESDDQPFVPLAVALRTMLAETEANAKAAPAERIWL